MSTPTRPFGRKQPPGPLPDAKLLYEPLLKRELARRIAVICIVYFVFMSLTLLLSTFDLERGPPLGIFGQLVAIILMAFSTLVVGAIPALILRGRSVSEPGIPPPTRAAQLLALAGSSRTWRTLTYFVASGFGLTFLHLTFITMSEWEDSRLSIFAPTRRNAYRLNERFFYLAFFNAGLGLVFSTRDLLRRRWVPKWPPVDDGNADIIVTSPYVFEGLFAALNHKALLSTTIVTIIHVVLFPFSYHIAAAFALPLLRNLPAISWIARPLLHGFGRTWAVDISWSRMFFLGFKTSLGWELVESSFDYWSVKPIAASPRSPIPNQVLVAGLHSRDRYFKHHSYLELSALAASPSAASAARRTALFTDSKTSPTLWTALLRELLITLGHHYQLLLRRGKPAPAIPPLKPQAVPSIPRTPKTPKTPLLRGQVLKPSPRSFFDKFASDGVELQSQSSANNQIEHSDVPSVFLSSVPSTPTAATEAVVKLVESKEAPMRPIMQKLKIGKNWAVGGLLRWLEGKLPSEWRTREWWTDIKVENVAISCLPESELDLAGINALSHLVAASLTEDALGVVQRDIPRILEALLSFLGEAERYRDELEANLPPPSSTGDDGTCDVHALAAARDVARAIEAVLPVIVGLRSGIVLIAKTFGERLTVYRFPPVTAKRLQTFMDYL